MRGCAGCDGRCSASPLSQLWPSRSPGGRCAGACRARWEVNAAGLAAAVTIERDARGVPVITAASRADLAFATGFAHAQDRYFQMDLSRRLAGGELSELFGAVALEHDTRARRFGFRAVARRVVAGAARRGARRARSLCARRERRARGPRRAAVGIPGAARAAARLERGGFGAGRALDVVAAAVRRPDRRDRPPPPRARRGRDGDAGRRARAHRVRLRRPFRLGHA